MTNDEIIREIERLSREVNMLKGSNLASMGAQSVMSGDIQMLGQTSIRIPIIYALSTGSNPTDLDANGVFMNAFGETFDGSTYYQLGGVNNGGLMFGLRSTDGSALFMGGQGIIDNTGINTRGIGYGLRQYAVDPTDPTTTRYFRLEMLLPDGRTQPAGSLTFTTGDETNLITNGDAETGDLSNWTESGTLWSADSSEYHGGAYSFKFDNNTSTAETLTSDRYAASASKIYSISAWMKDYNELVSVSIPVDKCTYMNSFIPTTNLYGANAASGWINSSSQKYHGLIKFDYSSIPNNIYSIYSSSINLHNYTLNSHVQNIYRCLVAWVETEATWNIYSTGNNWGTAGAENATDRETSVIGTKTVTTEEYQSISLDTSKTKDMVVGIFTNNGFVCRGVTESGVTNKAVEYQDYSDALRAYHSISYVEASKYTVYMKWYDDASAGNLIRTDTLFTENNTNSWNERTATVTAPAGALSYEIVISGGKGREFWVDDIVVAEQTFANKLLFLPQLSYQDAESVRQVVTAERSLYAPPACVATNTPSGSYVFQPNAADGYDSYLNSTNPTVTRDGGDMYVGYNTTTVRGIIKFDISSVPSDVIPISASIDLYCVTKNIGQAQFYPVLKNWVEAEVTWNRASTATAWTTAGCGSDGNDYTNTSSGAFTPGGSGEHIVCTLNANGLAVVEDFIDGTLPNYGWLIKADSESGSGNYNLFASSDHATASYRPSITINYDAGTSLDTGAYKYKITFLDVNGETELGAVSNTTTVTTGDNVVLSSLPLGPWGCTGRNVYRTTAGGSVYYYVDTISDNTTTTWIDTVLDADLGAVGPVVNSSGGRPSFPKTCCVFADQFFSNATCAITTTTSQNFLFYRGPTAANANDGDTYDTSVLLDGGTYTFEILTVTTTDCGKFDFYLDGVLISAGLEGYSGSATYNVVRTVTPVTVNGDGYHKILLKVNTKHASSSDYRLLFTRVIAYPTTDVY